MGYKEKSNVTIIDLSGVPFEVLSITVSLISRIIFEYGYFFKKADKDNKTPFLVVYEEAHRYVPKIQSAKYKSSRMSANAKEQKAVTKSREKTMTFNFISPLFYIKDKGSARLSFLIERELDDLGLNRSSSNIDL